MGSVSRRSKSILKMVYLGNSDATGCGVVVFESTVDGYLSRLIHGANAQVPLLGPADTRTLGGSNERGIGKKTEPDRNGSNPSSGFSLKRHLALVCQFFEPR